MRFIDLTGVQQRTQLRHLPPPPPDCKDEACLGVGGFGSTIFDGAPDVRDPRALTVQILSAVPERIDPAQPVEVEFRVLNSGSVPLEVPVSPHLSDLQPTDESRSFSYSSIALAVRVIIGDPQEPPVSNVSGFVELYGTAEDAATILLLKPGESIRVRDNIKLSSIPHQTQPAWLNGTFWLRNNTFRTGPGTGFTEIHNVYPNTGTAPPLRVQIMPAQ